MKTFSIALAALWLGLATAAAPAGAPEWIDAGPDHDWEFPRDHYSHAGYRTEWWYFTGQLFTSDPSQPRFGYQFTFFRVGLVPRDPGWVSGWSASDIVMGHAAITDLQSGEHRFSELVYRATPMLGGFPAEGGTLLAWSRSPPGSGGRWTLAWNGSGFDIAMRDDNRKMALRLQTRTSSPPVLQGENGWSRKNADGSASSLYYSYPRLETHGAVSLDDADFPVHGESWMDKEFGSSQLGDGQVGWDWFSLRLEDGRSLMLYSLRRADGTPDWRSGTLIGRDGSPRTLTSDEWAVTVNRRWKSPESRAEYPVAWSLEIPGEGIAVEIAPDLDAQENRSRVVPGLFYWEGSVSLTGEGLRGRGYVELTGYGEGSRPPHLTAPRSENGRGL